jgi:outer membrane protein TolC
MLNAAELEEHELSVSLASILAVDPLPGLIDADIAADFPTAVTSLEVLRARAQVARAQAMFASADSPLGADARAGGGFMRDLEGRESIAGTLEIGLPIFRRSFELQALRADADAAHAELAEAERVASIENDHARTRISSARANLALAVNGVHNAQTEREIAQRSHANGEASLADLTDARFMEAEAQALCATRRREVADAIARLESRAFKTEADEQSRDRLQALSQELSQEQKQPQTESSSGAAQ